MNIVFLVIFSASVFSIEGLGQEQIVFKTPFLGPMNFARIEFALKPELDILNSGSDFRGIFWTNPFYLNMEIPIYNGLVFSLGSIERFNQSFDIYSEKQGLKMYVQGRGGVEEIYLQLNQRLNIAEVFFRGSYLYGSSRETWKYTIDDYSIADTFFYKDKGEIFCAGLKLFMFSIFYEGLGKLDIEKLSNDTIYNLPQVLSLGLEHKFFEWAFCLLFEHSFWKDGNAINRFKGTIEKENLGFSYAYNPWYLNDIQEHLLEISIRMPLRNFAIISFNPDIGVRIKGSLREFVFSPEFKLTLEEIFARRKK